MFDSNWNVYAVPIEMLNVVWWREKSTTTTTTLSRASIVCSWLYDAFSCAPHHRETMWTCMHFIVKRNAYSRLNIVSYCVSHFVHDSNPENQLHTHAHFECIRNAVVSFYFVNANTIEHISCFPCASNAVFVCLFFFSLLACAFFPFCLEYCMHRHTFIAYTQLETSDEKRRTRERGRECGRTHICVVVCMHSSMRKQRTRFVSVVRSFVRSFGTLYLCAERGNNTHTRIHAVRVDCMHRHRTIHTVTTVVAWVFVISWIRATKRVRRVFGWFYKTII